MSCECNFRITSILSPYHRTFESYPQMPCGVAIDFLNALNRPKETSKIEPQSESEVKPEYRVLYNITNTDENYSNTMAESAEKAAATIQLFMKNPKWMPNKV